MLSLPERSNLGSGITVSDRKVKACIHFARVACWVLLLAGYDLLYRIKNVVEQAEP